MDGHRTARAVGCSIIYLCGGRLRSCAGARLRHRSARAGIYLCMGRPAPSSALASGPRGRSAVEFIYVCGGRLRGCEAAPPLRPGRNLFMYGAARPECARFRERVPGNTFERCRRLRCPNCLKRLTRLSRVKRFSRLSRVSWLSCLKRLVRFRGNQVNSSTLAAAGAR